MTVEELMQRATGGQRLARRDLFRPSLVYRVLHDPFWIWCEYHAPPSEAVDETSRYDQLKWQRGIEHEQAWVREHFPDARPVVPDFGLEALRNTLHVLLEGVPAITQPQLWDLAGGTYGKGDLLVRDDSRPSDLGPYHYRVVEIKRARSLQPHHALQAAFYNRILGKTQGYVPVAVTVALKDATEQVPIAATGKEVEAVLATWRAIREGTIIPEPGRPPDVTESPWRVYGNALVARRKDLVLLAGVGSRERERLRAAGIHGIDALWELRLEEICAILGDRSGAQAYYVAQAYRSGLPVLKPGGRLQIPRAARHLYFDFETSDDVHPTEPPHVYLIGVWDAERHDYVRFLARGAADEGRIFAEFAEYVGGGGETRLYHWSDYETGQMAQVMERWPHLAPAVRPILSSCVDLMRVIKAAVYLPVPTFSLKSVAPALGFRWRQEGFDAFESMVCYWEYLDGGNAPALAQALGYNEDDCRAMWHVDRELTTRVGGQPVP